MEFSIKIKDALVHKPILEDDLYLVYSIKNGKTVFIGYDEASGGYPYLTDNFKINYKTIIFTNYERIKDWFNSFTTSDYQRLGVQLKDTHIAKLEINAETIFKI